MLSVFTLRSVEEMHETKSAVTLIPVEPLVESNRDSNVSERRTIESATFQETSSVENKLILDVALLKAARNNPLFSAEIARLEERLGDTSNSFVSGEEGAELRDAIELMNEKIRSYAAETTQRIKTAVSEGNRTSFSMNFDSTKPIIALTHSSDYLLFTSIDQSSYFADHSSMIDAKRRKNIQLELEAAKNIFSVYQFPEIKQRIDDLQILELKQRTDSLEASINRNIADGLFVEAEKQADELRVLEPRNKNLGSYNSLIKEGLKRQSIDLLAAEITRNKNSENFNIALQLVNKLLNLDPTNGFANEAFSWLSSVIALNREINSLLSDTSRLSDPTVAVYAQKILLQAQNFEGVVLTANIAGQLEFVLQEYQTPIEILVKSDNIARIEIRGVGYIEPTESKIVMLKPGKYTLNAVCKGHRNNLMEAVFSDINRSIEVLCGDKL